MLIITAEAIESGRVNCQAIADSLRAKFSADLFKSRVPRDNNCNICGKSLDSGMIGDYYGHGWCHLACARQATMAGRH